MKNRKLSIIMISLIITAIVIFFVTPSIVMSTNKIEYRIFTSIEDLDLIPDSIVGNNVDKNLKNIDCLESRTLIINYKGNKYLLFAYTFNSVEDSCQYYKNIVNGSTPYSEYTTYINAFWLFNTRVLVRRQCNAYLVQGGFYSSTADFIRHINNYLTQTLK